VHAGTAHSKNLVDRAWDALKRPPTTARRVRYWSVGGSGDAGGCGVKDEQIVAGVTTILRTVEEPAPEPMLRILRTLKGTVERPHVTKDSRAHGKINLRSLRCRELWIRIRRQTPYVAARRCVIHFDLQLRGFTEIDKAIGPTTREDGCATGVSLAALPRPRRDRAKTRAELRMP